MLCLSLQKRDSSFILKVRQFIWRMVIYFEQITALNTLVAKLSDRHWIHSLDSFTPFYIFCQGSFPPPTIFDIFQIQK